MFGDDAPVVLLADAAAAAALVTSYRTMVASGTDLTTYTFSAADIGTASATRYVLVAATGRAGTPRTVSSVTIGGVSATGIQHHGYGNSTVSWWIANVPTGATGDIVVVWAGAMVRAAVAAWALENLQSTTPTAVASDNALAGNDLSTTINVVAGGGAFAAAQDAGGGGGKTYTWVGLTERYDAAVEAATMFWSGASLDFASVQTGLTVTTTENITTGTTDPGLSIIALR